MIKRTIKRNIIPLILMFIIAIFFGLFYLHILTPSYYSYLASCKPSSFENTEYVIVGTTQKSINKDTGEESIDIKVYYDDIDYTTLKHELIHKRQTLRSFTFANSCTNPIGKILTEVEAYSFEKLPKPIFEKLYGFDLDDYIE